jgi:glycosyltransferase involved in cell wall biosynthesis
MPNPTVSVVIAAYNARRFLPETLASVFHQTYASWEVIVVDDGSTDGTGELIREYQGKVIYLRQPNRGPSAARNEGIKIARGRYLAFLDSDDLWSAGKLAMQVDFMERNPQIGLVFSDMEEFDQEKTLCGSLLAGSLFASEMVPGPPIDDAERKLLVEDFIPTSTVLVRRECLAKVGLFDESFRFSEDRELWLRIARLFPIAVIPAVLGRKRDHDANLTKKSAEETLRARVRIWEQAFRLVAEPSTTRLLDELMADAHLALAYILWGKNERKEARRAGLRSIRYALKHAAHRGPKAPVALGYRWLMGIALIPLTFVKWSLARNIWRIRHLLTRENLGWRA